MKRKLFILVPALQPTGPIKGAYALANALAERRAVTLVSLKNGTAAEAPLNEQVRQVSLADRSGTRAKLRSYRELLRAAGGRSQVASISMCFSADLVNLFCRDAAVTCSSIRGNLMANYVADYGPAGRSLAMVHWASLRRFDRVVAMTRAMAQQVQRFSGVEPAIIGNFLDEEALEGHRSRESPRGPYRFVFLGSLSRRKKPLLPVEAAGKLRAQGVDILLDMCGSGAMQGVVEKRIAELGLRDHVRLHGFQAKPYPVLANADALVLPSVAEGVSRAAMEALYLGVPCVLRDVEGCSELVRDANGVLFRHDGELPAAMLTAARLSRVRSNRDSLLPAAFRQMEAAERYLHLVEAV